MIRDPRDVIVSWYYAVRDSHILMGQVEEHRTVLRNMSFQDGISYCIKAQALKCAFMRTWLEAMDDPNVLIIKFENLTFDPEAGFAEIFDHGGLDVPLPLLAAVLHDYSKAAMRRRDLAAREEGSASHYREAKTDWRGVFTDQ